MTKTQFDLWYKNKWLPEARSLTNQLAVMSRYLEKQDKAPSKETLDALSGKFADIRHSMTTLSEQLGALETRTL